MLVKSDIRRHFLTLFVGFACCVASGQHPWQKPLKRSRADVEQILGNWEPTGSIPGHNLFTFDDAYFRIILFRAMAWTMRQPMDPFKPLVTEGI